MKFLTRCKNLASLILRPQVIKVIGLVLLLSVLFFGGRLLREQGYLALSDWELGWVCGAVLAVAIIASLWGRYRALKNALRLEDEMRQQGQEHLESLDVERRVEAKSLQEQFEESLGALKSSELGKRALYALPWYVIVGPPASGKTTMLSRSGLHFPFTVQGARSFRGIGGTRNCDWWFTDKGILLDTAGRYTTETEDHPEWLSFLGMLRRTRKQKPINGALVAIGIDELLSASDEKLSEHAGRIRERLIELNRELRLDMPIYLVFTKCDLLEGFVETFEEMDRDERNQVWGYTVPEKEAGKRPLQDVFREQLGRLHERLCNRRLSLLAWERSPGQDQRIYSFPVQFSLARERLNEFVQLLVQPNPYQEGSTLRGFYFTSGTQEGTLIDQLSSVAGESGEAQPPAESDVPAEVADEHAVEPEVPTRSYFVHDLFTEVVFPDENLARSSSRLESKRRVLRRTAVAACIAATILLSVWLGNVFWDSSLLIAQSADALDDVWSLRDHRPAGWQETTLSPDEMDKIDRVRAVFVELDDEHRSLKKHILGSPSDLHETMRKAYATILQEYLVAPCQEQLEERLAGIDDDTIKPIEYSRELALYILMGDSDRVSASDTQDLLEKLGLWGHQQLWQGELAMLLAVRNAARTNEELSPDDSVESSRTLEDHLDDHLTALVERVIGFGIEGEIDDWQRPVDDAVKEKAETFIWEDNTPFLELILDDAIESIRREPLPTLRVLVEASGQLEQLDVGIDSNSEVKIESAFLSPDAMASAWEAFESQVDQLVQDSEDVKSMKERGRLKLDERCRLQWLEALASLKLSEPSNLAEAGQNVKAHAGENAFFEEAVLLVQDRLDEHGMLELARGKDLDDGSSLWLKKALTEVQLIDVSAYTDLPDVGGGRVIRDLEGNGGSQIWAVAQAIDDRWREADRYIASCPYSKLQESTRDALNNLKDSVRDALVKEVRSEAEAYWSRQVGSRLLSFKSMYPFHDSESDVQMKDFTDIFHPETGSYSSTYELLEELTKPHGPVPALLVFSPATELDRMAVEDIQAAMWSSGTAEPSVTFKVDVANDADVFRTQLDFGRETVSTEDMRPSRLREKELTWSGSSSLGAAIHVSIATVPEPTIEEKVADIDKETAWSLFRLIEKADSITRSPSDPERIDCEWVFDYKPTTGKMRDEEKPRARLGITTGEKPNPFAKDFFRNLEFAQNVFRQPQ